MKKYNPYLLTGLFSILAGLIASSAAAETRYVIDTLYVSLRDKAAKQYDTVMLLKSDTPVEVVSEKDEYCKARTREGEEGWIPCRYLSKATPKPVVIDQLRQEVDNLKAALESVEDVESSDAQTSCEDISAENTDLTDKVSRLESRIAEKDQTLLEMEKKLSELKEQPQQPQQPDNSEQLERARQENQALAAENESLQTEIERIKKRLNGAENGFMNSLFADGKGWFFSGAAVFILGLLFGSFMKNSRNRKFY